MACVDLLADVEAKIGGDLLVAAAAGVELEAERADALDQLQLDEVMNVFGGWMIADERLAGFRCVVGGDGVERVPRCSAVSRSVRIPAATEGGRVRLAGGDFLGEQPPVKDDGALPCFEFAIERLAKAAGPHLHVHCLSFFRPAHSKGRQWAAEEQKQQCLLRVHAVFGLVEDDGLRAVDAPRRSLRRCGARAGNA